ncbi:MAG: glutathione S-transferase family protein [Verrucomicrobiae bacterium]|nr:glutathione S-transferase family protein [Verrucomicrobiae bacterium]
MKVQLHELAHSPFCIPVKRIFETHNIPFETREIPAWDRRELARLTRGAYYQVPVLECENHIVHETPEDPLAVAHFIDQQFLDGTLFPAHCTGIHEIVIGHIEDTLEGKGFKLSDPHVVDAMPDLGERVMVIRHKERSFGRGCVDRWKTDADSLLEELNQALQPYEKRLGREPWLFGDSPVYADYALFGILGNFQYGGHHTLDPQFKNLQRWQAALAEYEAG